MAGRIDSSFVIFINLDFRFDIIYGGRVSLGVQYCDFKLFNWYFWDSVLGLGTGTILGFFTTILPILDELIFYLGDS
jgi:hypothetical protein